MKSLKSKEQRKKEWIKEFERVGVQMSMEYANRIVAVICEGLLSLSGEEHGKIKK